MFALGKRHPAWDNWRVRRDRYICARYVYLSLVDRFCFRLSYVYPDTRDNIVHQDTEETKIRWGLVWFVSLASCTLIGSYYGALRYKWLHDSGAPADFWKLQWIPLLNSWIAGVLIPGIYWLVRRFPIEHNNWQVRVPLHLMGSLLFTFLHAAGRLALAPFRNEHGQTLPFTGLLLWRMFIAFTYDDAIMTYWPILTLVEMLDFHKRSRKKELRASQLQTELAKAQLQSLKTQLQPHFLFNTLNSISALMHVNVTAADQMISELSSLLRVTLESGDIQESTVREELEFVQGYLRIEQTRYSDRLTVSFDIDPSTYDARFPHMLLQPLVENAVRHGIAKRTQVGRIEISAQREADNLVISISDNGCGFDL